MAQNLVIEMLQAIDNKYCTNTALCRSMTNGILTKIEGKTKIEEIVELIVPQLDEEPTDEQFDVIETIAEQLICLQELPVKDCSNNYTPF